MREGSIIVVVCGEDRRKLERRAKLDHRSLISDEASYLLHWALEELERREAAESVVAA